MKRIIKSLTAVTVYLLLLCYLLGTEAVLLLSPKHIGMFLLGCIILCLPSLERKTGWREFGEIFRKNAIMAGYLETVVLLFAGVNQRKMAEGEFLREFALSLRPVFYGFVCHLILRGEELTEKDSAKDGAGRENSPQDGSLKKTSAEKKMEQKPDLSGLTRQEKLIADLVSRGLTNREIGEELCISETTVKKHISNIFEKTGISSRRELR